ncbi:MAG: hypothetical protein A2039_07490 [Candidatus Melainabacteria bacterium GWA2_34_9]|nr:MAG: hypothetical protein A2039_07490 [Candidatus Melainabacteria bacterium GWA2_34_9]
MKKKLKNMAKMVFSAAFVSLMLAVVPVYAFDGATLSEIKISSKDNYSYKIILKADKDVPVEKYVTSDNKIVIDLKNTRSAEFVNTIYNNTPEIDNVIVQAVAGDKVRVFIQGLNIASSKVILDSRSDTLDFMGDKASSVPVNNTSVSKPEVTALTQTAQSNQDIPVINLAQSTAASTTTAAAVQEPVKPQYSENNLQPPQDNLLNTENNNIETVKNSMVGNAALKKIFSKEGFDWLLRIFAVVFIAIGMFKFISKPKNVTIDLASDNLREREIELYRTANERKELLARSLGSNYTREKQVKNQAYGANSQHAVREYQNSQLPPQRLNRPVDSGINRPVAPKIQASQLNSALKTTKTATGTRKPVVNNSKISQKEIKTAKTNVDNIKFLENMAAIYQKSGRDDLAHNIRQKIKSTREAS